MNEKYISPYEIHTLMNKTLDMIKSSALDEDKKALYRARVTRAANTENSYYNLLTEACAIAIQLLINKYEYSKELVNYQPTYIPIKDLQEATEDRIIDLSMSHLKKCDICGRTGNLYDPVEQILLFPHGLSKGVIPINYCHTCYMHRSDRVRALQILTDEDVET